MEALQDEKWGDGTQHDAQEFLHALLDQLQVTVSLILQGGMKCFQCDRCVLVYMQR